MIDQFFVQVEMEEGTGLKTTEKAFIKIEEQIIDLLALYQPLAIDLRFLTTAMLHLFMRRGQASLEYTDLDKVGYDVQMTGGSLLDCKPRDGLVRLTNDLGKIVCQFDVPGASSFETPLTVRLNYNYIQSFQKGIQIVKTPE